MKKGLRILVILSLLALAGVAGLRWAVLPGALRYAQTELRAAGWPQAVVRQPGWDLGHPQIEVYAAAGDAQPVLQVDIAFLPSLIGTLTGGPTVIVTDGTADCTHWPVRGSGGSAPDLKEWLSLKPRPLSVLPDAHVHVQHLAVSCLGIPAQISKAVLQTGSGGLVLEVRAGTEAGLEASWDTGGVYSINVWTAGSSLRLSDGTVLQVPVSRLHVQGGDHPLVSLTASQPVLPAGPVQLTDLQLNLNEQGRSGTILPFAAGARLNGRDLKLVGTLDLAALTARASFTGDIKMAAVEAIGVKGDVRISSLWPLVISGGQKVSIKALQLGGLPLTAVSAQYSFAGGAVRLQQAQGLLFGGRVTVPATTVPLSVRQISTVVELTDIDLGQLIQLGNVQGLSGDGRISGRVPVTYAGGKITLGQTELTAGQVGHIRYQPDEMPVFMAPGGQGALLGEVFRDFSYDGLTLRLGGTLGDNLTLGVRLAGNNPSFYNGHPVVLNLNLSGALDSLLREGLKTFSFTPQDLGELVREGAKP